MNRSLAFTAAVVALTGCAGVAQKIPEPFGTRPAEYMLRDGATLLAVKAKLTEVDPDSTTTLGVSVRDGVVDLHGTVRDAAHKKLDAAAARKVHGVHLVVNELRIDPRGPRPGLDLSEAALGARIVAAYTAEVGLQHVDVQVSRGVATLAGTVSNPKIRQTIVAAARGTSGVHAVIDHIRIGKS